MLRSMESVPQVTVMSEFTERHKKEGKYYRESIIPRKPR